MVGAVLWGWNIILVGGVINFVKYALMNILGKLLERYRKWQDIIYVGRTSKRSAAVRD